MSHPLHDLYDFMGAAALLVGAVAGLLKAWASVKEVGLKETAKRGYGAVRRRVWRGRENE